MDRENDLEKGSDKNSQSGFAILDTSGKSAMTQKSAATVSGSAAVDAENAPQGPSTSISGNDGTLSQKPHQAPEKGLRTQNARPKLAKKWPIVLGVVIGLLVVGGIVAWLLLSNQQSDSMTEPDSGDGGGIVAPESKWNADIYGYGAVCAEPADGADTSSCNIVELHKDSDDVVLANYTLSEDKGDIFDTGWARLVGISDNFVCWVSAQGRVSYDYPSTKGRIVNAKEAVSCIDRNDQSRKVRDALQLDTGDGAFTQLLQAEDKLYYKVGRYDEMSSIAYSCYDLKNGETKKMPSTDGDWVHYDERDGVFYGYNGENTEYRILDDDWNVIETMADYDSAIVKYPGIKRSKMADDLYLQGKKIEVSEDGNKLLYDGSVIYERQADNNGQIRIGYSGVGDVFGEYLDGKKVLFGVANGCGGQTCSEFKSLEYDTETGDITELEGWKFWEGTSRDWGYSPIIK